MIALIEFTNDLVLLREEAVRLNLKYEQHDRFGASLNYDKRKTKMYNNNYYIDELEKKDGKYYKADGTEVGTYYVYNRLPDKDWVYVDRHNHMVDLNKFAPICKYEFVIKKCVESVVASTESLMNILNAMEEKFHSMQNILQNNTFNQKCDVHVGGGLIVTYNEVQLQQDCCTDELQTCLDNGWRVIACCVQPDQRRPDYILGRYSPKE